MARSTIVRSAMFALALGAGSAALAQSALHSNAGGAPDNPGLATGATSANGTPAPNGFSWSECQRATEDGVLIANAVAGFATGQISPSGPYRFADDVIAPSPGGWLVDRLSIYAYVPDATSQFSPFSAVNLRVWNGPPNAPGSAVVFGDATANRLIAATPTDLYRIVHSAQGPAPQATDLSRLIWKLDVSTVANGHALSLRPGRYWLDWQIVASTSGADVFTPALTIANQRTGAGWNAMQLKPVATGATWVGATDLGKPAFGADVAQDLPFLLAGNVRCPADLDDGSLAGVSDGGVDINDLLYFLAQFEAGSVNADLDDGTGTGTPDQGVDINDLLYMLARLAQGC